MTPSAEAGPVCSVRGLTVSFRSGGVWRPAVDNLRFDVAARKTMALVGESGSGKSVTALAIMRLLSGRNCRVEGEIRLGSESLLALPEERMRTIRGAAIAMIFQEPMTSLNPVMTIGRQIAEALHFHRNLNRAAAAAEAVRLLERVQVPAARQRFQQYPHSFSGGMRQRVMIAIALACKPKLLIADEPTTALDVTVQAQILELIKLLQDEEGMSVIFITHDMSVVAEIADSVVVMRQGRLIEQNRVAELLQNPQQRYTQALLAAVPRLGSMKGEAAPKPFPEPEDDESTPSVQAPRAPATSPSRPLLEVRNLVTRFPLRAGLFGRLQGHVHAVEGISFSLGAGETLALVGESGCGKSTTGRSILRLVEPSGGEIRFEGADIRALDRRGLREMRQRIQMVFQDPFASLNPRIRVGDAISEPIVVHGLAPAGEARERVAELLRKVGLSPDMAQRLPHEFSGGQRQRIAIARALALGPKLIVADEAVSALDVSIRARIVNLMMRLQEELGVSYLFISHDIAVVERVSHRIAVMFQGEIVEIGPRAAVIENPSHVYTRKLIGAAPALDASRRQIRRGLSNEEPISPIKPVGYQPPQRQMREVSPGHFVQEVAEV
jgi:peptide/nickel transport system ATP-binding protein